MEKPRPPVPVTRQLPEMAVLLEVALHLKAQEALLQPRRTPVQSMV
jgi:hypothetical protein